jgi:hypothetical protein
VAVVVGAILGLALASCSAEQSRPGARAVLQDALAAFADRDEKRLCDSLSSKARLVIGHAAHNARPLDCVEDVTGYLSEIEPYAPGFDVRAVDVRSPAAGRAVADVRLPGGALVTMPLREEDGRWKLDGLFDGGLSRIQLRGEPGVKRLMRLPDSPPPVKTDGSVNVRGADGKPCPPLDDGSFPTIEGGCITHVEGKRLRMLLETPFGVMHFDDCDMTFDLHVDGAGRAWLVDMSLFGGLTCFDVMPCLGPINEKIPWQGRIERSAAGSLRLRVPKVCLDTCIGRFEGGWDIALAKGGHGWRLRSRSMVGTSGWRLDGAFQARGKPIAIAGGR